MVSSSTKIIRAKSTKRKSIVISMQRSHLIFLFIYLFIYVFIYYFFLLRGGGGGKSNKWANINIVHQPKKAFEYSCFHIYNGDIAFHILTMH